MKRKENTYVNITLNTLTTLKSLGLRPSFNREWLTIFDTPYLSHTRVIPDMRKQDVYFPEPQRNLISHLSLNHAKFRFFAFPQIPLPNENRN